MSLLDIVPWGGAISKGLDVIKSLIGMGERKEERNEGAIAQDDKTKTDELKSVRDDRVRDSDDQLAQRVRNDHGIISDP